MWEPVGAYGYVWVLVCALNQAPIRKAGGRVVLSFWFVLWVHVGTLNKIANYGRISKVKVCMEVS